MTRRDPNGRRPPAHAPRGPLCLLAALAGAALAGCATAPAPAPVATSPEPAATAPAPAAAPAPDAAVPAADPERFAGLWDGAILYEPGSAELEVTVELAVDSRGRLVGTLDQAAFDMLYHPLEDVRVEGPNVYFSYRRDSEVRGPNALFSFEGRLDESGDLVGEFLESRGRIPFRLERLGDPGSPRPVLERRPLADLGPEGDELVQAFNEDEDKARLVLLLSPT